MKKILSIISCLSLFIGLVACSSGTSTTRQLQGDTTPSTADSSTSSINTGSATTIQTNSSQSTLAPTTAIPTTVTAKDVADYTVIDVSTIGDGETYTISESGKYALTGTSSNAQIKVNGSGIEVELALNGVNLTFNGSEAPLYVKEAGSFTLEIVDGTTNTLSDSINNTVDAVLEVKKCDLVITGNGTLNIYALGPTTDEIESGCGIYNSKSISIISGNIIIKQANDHAISGKTGITISGGTITVETAAGDALHAKEGDITLSNTTLTTNTNSDAMDAGMADDGTMGNIYITNGTYNLTTQGVFALYVASEDTDGSIYEDSKYIKSGSSYIKIATDDMSKYSTRYYLVSSAKGIKADANVQILGGTFVINTTDDGIKADNKIQIYNGNFTINTSDDGISAEKFLQIGGSEITSRTEGFIINIESSYEGIESEVLEFYDGLVQLTSTDDGINSSTEDDTVTKNDMYIHFGGDTFVIVNSTGDGIDSNGSISMYSGTVYVFGPTNSANGALDYETDFFLSGGTLIAVGASGMAQVPDNPSIYTVSITYSSSYLSNGSYIYLGNSTKSYVIKLPKSYTSGMSLIIASTNLSASDSLSFQINGTTNSSLSNNVAYNADYTNGTTVTTLTLSNLITTYGSVGMGGTSGGGSIGGSGIGGFSGDGGSGSGRPGGR